MDLHGKRAVPHGQASPCRTHLVGERFIQKCQVKAAGKAGKAQPKGSFDLLPRMGDNQCMAIDPNAIELTDAQKRALAELSELTGKPWSEVFSEALSGYQPKVEANGTSGESFSAAAARLGFLGCVEGPADLSTNPAYMEGFGESEN